MLKLLEKSRKIGYLFLFILSVNNAWSADFNIDADTSIASDDAENGNNIIFNGDHTLTTGAGSVKLSDVIVCDGCDSDIGNISISNGGSLTISGDIGSSSKNLGAIDISGIGKKSKDEITNLASDAIESLSSSEDKKKKINQYHR